MARRISRTTLRWSARVGAALLSLVIVAPTGVARTPNARSVVTRASVPLAATRAAASTVLPTVILYGDSLAFESQTHFRDALLRAGITDVHTKTFGGTALCDWIDDMRADALSLKPTVVIIEFSGNALTPCMHDENDAPLIAEAYFSKYVQDAGEALRIFRPTGAAVYFVGAPISRHAAEVHDPNAGRLNTLYSDIAAMAGAKYVDAGAAVLDHGRWTATMPCRVTEPCTGSADGTDRGVNVVRSPDGVHFCPNAGAAEQGVTDGCAVWSSGAYRFGSAMAAPIITTRAQNARGTAS